MSTAAIPQPKVKQLLPETWTARWITPPQADFQIPAGSRPAHELSTIFELTELPSSAWLFATAAGVYEAFLNGHRVGAQELTPGSTSYDETLYAQVYPVADQLQIGTNELRFVLSDGWYWGQVGAHRSEANWGDHLGILAELQVNTDTGQRAVVVATDDKWLARPSQITRASLMDGQTTDFTAPIAEALPVLVDRVVAPTPTASPAPPVIVAQVLKPKSVTQLSDSEWIVDFGQNASGWVRLSDLGPAGTVTEIDFGEYLNPKGELETSHLDSVRPGEGRCVFRQQDVVISDGTGRVFEPRHTVHGFQFARVRRSGHGFDPNSIEMQVVHTDLAPTGTFECSNADLNRLYEMSRWSFLGNAVDVPTDCPTRERLGWTGDYQVFAPTATRLFDVLGFSRKWLQSVRDDQLPDGRISSFSPDHRRLKGNLGQQMAMMAGAAGWGDAIVYVPWQMYRSYGDTQVLEENWEAMKRWVDWAAETAATKRHQSRVELSDKPAPHEEFIWDGSFHWGEWLEPVPKAADGTRVGEMQVNPHLWFTADKGEVATAYLYLSALRIAEIAWVTGRNSEAAHYAELAAHVRAAWLTEYFDEEGHTKSDTQASYVRALAFDLIPGEMKPAAVARLVELIRAADTHLGTGFLSTAYLLPVLAENGHAELAYELLFRRTPPSWMYMVDQGATTIWEDWEGIDDTGAHDSLNHYTKGAVTEFLLSHVLGLRQAPGSVGWQRVVVAPLLTPEVTWARGTQETPHGMISVSWRHDDERLVCEVEIPPGVTAEVVLPGGVTETVTGGSHTVIAEEPRGSR